MQLMKKCFSVNSQILFRTFKRRAERNTTNPGVNQRLNLLKQDQPDISGQTFDEESWEDLPEDARELDAFHKRKIGTIQKKVMFKQIERKYFTSEKLPNMLLWAEKEQIKLLAQTNPELWTPQKLAESFPATPEIIKKVLKSTWKPLSENRIKAHDESVISNWRSLELGVLNLPSHLEQHLKTYTSRKDLHFKPVQKLPEKFQFKEGEFLSLIKQNKQPNSVETKTDNENILPKPRSLEVDTYILGNSSHRRNRRGRQYTLREIRERNLIEDSHSAEYTFPQIPNNREVLNEMVSTELQTEDNDIEISNVHSTSVKDCRVGDISQNIKIPRSKWKKGCTYKVNNCYYSDDGDFLFRV